MSKPTFTILCTDREHPVYPYLQNWCEKHRDIYNITLALSVKEAGKYSGDILFLVSCSELVKSDLRENFRYTLVLHASALPAGRGWSPHIWDIINGSDGITLSLLNAEDKVDTGNIWQQKIIKLDGTELYNEINHLLFNAELELISWACKNIDKSKSSIQIGAGSYYRKRIPEDSRIDPDSNISKQFDLLRVCDPERFPAFFDHRGQRYTIRIEKQD